MDARLSCREGRMRNQMRRMVVETTRGALLAQPSKRNEFAEAKSDTAVESAFAGMAETRTLGVLA